ncbi:MAG: hypothetical protein AB7U85_04890 [Alphaproteobacteria bacterium]
MSKSDFEKEAKKELKKKKTIQKDTEQEVFRLLQEANKEITATLAGAPTDYQQWSLSNLQKSIAVVTDELGENLASSATKGASDSWNAGIGLVDNSINAATGINLAANLQQIDTKQLMSMRTFLTDRMKDVSKQAAQRINSNLGLVMIGAKTPFEAVSNVKTILNDKAGSRARTILNTELGRAYSCACQERMADAAEAIPKLKKQWRRSGRVNSRHDHDLADGQVVDVDKPFIVGGHELMYPRDPKAPASQTVNCGCVALPYMEDWEMAHPKNKPFSDEELFKSQEKREVKGVRADSFANWAERITSGKLNAAGNSETIGQIPSSVKSFLIRKNVDLKSFDVGVSDKQILHMARSAKAKRGAALSMSDIKNIPEHIDHPKAILWDKRSKDPSLVYIFDIKDSNKFGKLAVKLNDKEKRNKPSKHNWIATGGKVEHTNIRSDVYEVIVGEI